MAKILIQVIQNEREEVRNNLILFSQKPKRNDRAEIIAVSDHELPIKKGDKIFFNNNNDRLLELDGISYFEVDESCILAIYGL